MEQNYSYIKTGGGKFDYLKIFLAIIIVAIHSRPLPDSFMPLLRCAVPLFFMMSSYFFFLKHESNTDGKARKVLLNKYVKRNLKLYLFWFCLLLPITIVRSHWHQMSIVQFVSSFLVDFLFRSTFAGSWYIMASIWGVILVFYLQKICNNKILLAIGLVLYLLCCLSSNYYNIAIQIPIIKDIVIFTGKPYNSFPSSIIWIVVGKILAEKPRIIKSNILFATTFCSIVLLYIEYFIVNHFSLVRNTDCYLFLIPVCVLLFIAIGQAQFKGRSFRNQLLFRKLSTIIYCSHLSIIFLITKINIGFTLHNNIFVFILTLFLSISLGLLLINLSQKKHLNWLKYSF